MTLHTELATSTRSALLLAFLAVAVAGLAAEQETLVSDTKTAQQELFQDKPLQLGSKVSYAWTGDVLTNPLDAGCVGIVKVHIVNSSPYEWQVSGADASCGCVNAGVSSNNWPSGQSNVVELRIKVPSHQSSTEFRTSVKLKAKAITEKPFDVQIYLQVHGVIDGMVSFPNKLIPLDISGDQDIFRIPIVCSSDHQNIGAECSRPELISGGKLVEKYNRKMIEFVLAKDFVSKSGDYCQLTVTDSKSGMSDTVTMMFERVAKASVSPRTLRFARDDDGDFKASAIVRFVKPLSDGESKNNKPGKPLIEAKFNGNSRVRIKQQPMGANLTRLEIKLSEKAISQEAPDEGHFIQWNLMNQKSSVSVRSPVVISKN